MRSKGSEETEHRKQHNLAQLSLNPKFSILELAYKHRKQHKAKLLNNSSSFNHYIIAEDSLGYLHTIHRILNYNKTKITEYKTQILITRMMVTSLQILNQVLK